MRTEPCGSWSSFIALAACAVSTAWGLTAWGGESASSDRPQVTLGRELFTREWMPGPEPGRKGDGLGPFYNETSCVACHNQGGVGGAGAASQNVDFVTATLAPAEGEERTQLQKFLRRNRRAEEGLGPKPPRPRAKGAEPDREELFRLHEGFRESATIVLHRFGVDKDYAIWRLHLLHPDRSFLDGPHREPLYDSRERRVIQIILKDSRLLPEEWGDFELRYSERNSIPLFGAGLIEAIPDAVLEQQAEREANRLTAGRVSRLEDHRIGRFGWKAQTSTLHEFVLIACAVELGLEVPGHHQASHPKNRGYRAPGEDLNAAECAALTAFVRELPRPVQRTGTSEREASVSRSGEKVFERIGCAECHVPSLGAVRGLYSDLLLHDLGGSTGDIATYRRSTKLMDEGVTKENRLDKGFLTGPEAFEGSPPKPKPAVATEWRTPPLWGVRDSGPYFHDGRAETLDEAIAMHNGQGLGSAIRYFRLSREERVQVEQFLKSLRAPTFLKTETEQRREGTEPADF